MCAQSQLLSCGANPPVWAVLVDAIENLSAARNLDRVTEIVRLAARRIADADGATFVLRDGDQCHYYDEDAIGPLWKGQKFPLSACISGWAMLNKSTAVVPDIYADSRIPHDAYRPTFVQSLMMTPVRVEDPLGAIGVYWARPYKPDAAEITLLETLARASAISLANIALEGSLRQALDEAKAQAGKAMLALTEVQRETAARLEVEEQLRQSQKMEAIGHLTGGMAHDFNNMLGIISGNLELLREDRAYNPLAEEFIAPAYDAAMRGADLIRRLLAFARRQPLQPQRIDINAMVERMSNLATRTLGHEIGVGIDLAAGPLPVIADPAQLETSLINLANNARDAMPHGGKLSFKTSTEFLGPDFTRLHTDLAPGDYAVIEVSDTGTGIPAALQAQIFEPFFTTKEQGRGTGLGLSMVFGFIRQSGGHISVHSIENKGTAFRLYLPLANDSKDEPSDMNETATALGNGEIVLIAEDSGELRRVLVRQLVSLNYRVIESSDVDTALGVLETQDVDLLLTDVNMNGTRNGYDLCRIACVRWPAMRVVVMSGTPDSLWDADPLAAQLNMLRKPYRRQDLAQLLRAELDKTA